LWCVHGPAGAEGSNFCLHPNRLQTTSPEDADEDAAGALGAEGGEAVGAVRPHSIPLRAISVTKPVIYREQTPQKPDKRMAFNNKV
jgi:hypothetical protein